MSENGTDGDLEPMGWEAATLETPWGPIRIGGSFSTAYLKSVEGRFALGGERVELEATPLFTENGLLDIIDHRLMRNGIFGDWVPAPRAFKATIATIVREWASDPANLAMIARNEIKSRTHSIKVTDRNVRSLRKEAENLELDIATDRDVIARLESVFGGLDPATGGPKP